MRWAIIGVGAALLVVGSVWIFQGVGVLKGSFMTGSTRWAWIGAGCTLVGISLLARGLWRGPR